MLTPDTDLAGRLFQNIDFSGGAVAAVSGGSDSTALLILLKQHLDRAFPAARLLAVTVDHGLRRDSAAEAAAVARLCAAHGIAHRVMAWTGEKPAQGLPAAAREARYRLLAQAASDAGLGMVVTGHTADDQAETVLMRQMRAGDDRRGLAGMAPATLYDGKMWIMRPLLGMRRAQLRAFLEGEGIGWTEDPTNADEAFERPRACAALAADGASVSGLLAVCGDAAGARTELGRRAAGLIRSFADLPAAGLVRLAPPFAAAGDRQAAVHALRILLAVMGGVAFLPDMTATEKLLEKIAAAPFRATLSRTVVDARRTGIFLHREQRGLPPAAAFCDGAMWDGRRRITFGDGAGGLVIAARGAEAAAAAGEVEGVPRSLVRAALAAEPAVWLGDAPPVQSGRDTPGHENIAEFSVQPVAAPFARFLPCFDLAPARAVAGLVGAPAVPEPPSEDAAGAEPSCKA